MAELLYFSLSSVAAALSPAAFDSTPEEIPILLDTPLFTERVKLDDRAYDLRFDWNGRERRWYLSIAAEGQTIAAGVKVVGNWTLLLTSRSHTLAPRGALVAVDFSDRRGAPPVFNELGQGRRVRLLYYSAPPAGASLPGDFAAAGPDLILGPPQV